MEPLAELVGESAAIIAVRRRVRQFLRPSSSSRPPPPVRSGAFREDLYHRLAVLTIKLPPLRDRGDDLFLLAERFLARACHDYGLPTRSLGEGARAALRAYSWPGNVRELANVIERAALL